MLAVDLRNLTKRFGSITAVNDLSLQIDSDDAIARGEVSAVMQNGGLLKDFTVGETVAYTASLYAHARPVSEVLERAGIGEIADRRVAKCSGGEQQRLRFAMALLSDPRLLILDEPTTGMDVEGRREFWGAIREDAERGRTVTPTSLRDICSRRPRRGTSRSRRRTSRPRSLP